MNGDLPDYRVQKISAKGALVWQHNCCVVIDFERVLAYPSKPEDILINNSALSAGRQLHKFHSTDGLLLGGMRQGFLLEFG